MSVRVADRRSEKENCYHVRFKVDFRDAHATAKIGKTLDEHENIFLLLH